MNLFVGIGKITNAYENGRVLKFTLDIKQERSCRVPCLIFDPDDEIKGFIKQAQTDEKSIWLKGKISTYEFESNGKKITKVDVISHPKSIQII